MSSRLRDSELDSLGIEVFVAMSEEQAKEEGRAICISPELPDSRRVYFLLDNIPDDLCLEKRLDWQKVVKISKENVNAVMNFLYQDDTKIAKLQKMIDQVQGNCFWLYGFGD